MQTNKLNNFTSPRGWQLFLLGLSVFVNFSALFVTILEPDGALYAVIAKNMVLRNDYVNLIAEGKDWLDKPHFPFWVTAFSFKLFGIASWSYKLPALLFILCGSLYTFLLARKLYNQNIAIWSVIFLLTAQHIIISNNDVRAEPYLTGLIIAGMYHFYVSYKEKKLIHILWGSLFAAAAIMTKGMFALIPIAGGIFFHLLLKRDYKEILHARWLLAAVLIMLFITPELYCLWLQFDSHPEKITFGRTGVSGIRFFFWDSQFGRFFNTGPIKGKGDPFFFIHTLLWAFLPWSILMYASLGSIIKKNWRNPYWQTEWICFAAAVLTLLVFSLSRFQLPHYANIVFPFLAIMLAAYLHQLKSAGSWKFVLITQWIIVVIMLIAPVLLHLVFKPTHYSFFVLIVTVILLIVLVFLHKIIDSSKEQLILSRTVLASVILNLYLNSAFYPSLVKYQAGSEAAFRINQTYPGIPVAQVKQHYTYSLEFFLDQPLITVDSIEKINTLNTRPLLVYAIPEYAQHINGQLIDSFDYFPVTRLDGKFVNHKTRAQSVKKFYLKLVQ